MLGKWFGGGLDREDLGSFDVPEVAPVAMVTDHNAIGRAGSALYDVLTKEWASVFSDGKYLAPEGGYVRLGNLEYKTPALDEMAAGSNARFKKLATAIDAHATKIFANAPADKLSIIPDTTPQAGTGVPVAELKTWLGDPLPAKVQEALDAVRAEVKWSMYLQATAGVLPTGLPALYKARAEAMPDSEERGVKAVTDASKAIVAGIDLLFAGPLFQQRLATYLAGAPELDRPGHSLALRGALMVGLSYAIGNALNQTDLMSGTKKNAVPLLVKMADIKWVQAALTQWLRDNPLPDELITTIAKWMHGSVPQTELAYWKAKPYDAVVVSSKARGKIYAGDGADATAALLKRLLTGAGGVDTSAGPGTPLKALDPVSAAIGGARARGQGGLPVEYRYLLDFPSAAGELWPQFEKVLAEVREANLVHVASSERQAIRDSWALDA